MIYRNFIRLLGRGAAAPVHRVSPPIAHLLETALSAVQAADVIEREPDDNGPRIAIIAPGLGGAFYWSYDETKRRVEIHFPGMSAHETACVINALRARVKLAAQPAPVPRRRAGYVHSWYDERNLESFA